MSRRHLGLIALAVLAVLAVSIAVGRSFVSSPSTTTAKDGRSDTTPATPPAQVPATPPAQVPAGFAAFADPQSGFSISYPQSWTRLPANDPQVRLLAADGTKLSLLIRVSPVGLTVTRETLSVTRKLTDSLVGAARDVRLLAQPTAITLDGLPGYRYLYTFAEAGEAGRRGAHAHYFVFRGQRLITLVFQVRSVRELKRYSGLLERIAGTFQATTARP